MGCPHDRQPSQGQGQGQWPPVPSPLRNLVYLSYPWPQMPAYPVPMQVPAQSSEYPPSPRSAPCLRTPTVPGFVPLAPARPPRDALHPCIDGGGVPLCFDVRESPRRALPEHARFAGWSVFPEPVRDLRLVARAFPWPLEIRNELVVCGTIWERVHAALRAPIAEAEWALLCADSAKKRAVERAMKHRIERDPDAAEKVPLRIDYLGEETMFMGLEKDEAFVESVLLPGKRKVETWVIKMGRR